MRILLGSIFAWSFAISASGQTACEYVEKITQPEIQVGNTFQLLNSYTVESTKKATQVTSTQRLNTLPHVLWGMSQLSENVDHIQRKPIDMPSIEGFMVLAKKAYDSGQLGFVKWRSLQAANLARSNTILRSARKTAVIGEIEKSFPGVVGGQAGDFSESRVFKQFLEATGFKKTQMKEADWNVFAIWKTPLPLWLASRDKDLEKSLQIIERAASGGQILSEQACAWLLRERTFAQFVSFMGTRGAPKLTADGRLDAELWVNGSPRGEALYPVEDRPNAQGQFVDADWVRNRLDGLVDLNQEYRDTGELLALMGFATSWISNRGTALWQTTESSAARYSLPLDILRLGFGVLGVGLKNFSMNHLTVLPGGRIQLRSNGHENLVQLGWVSLSLSRNLTSLSQPNEVERAALTAHQIQEFVGAGGVREKLYQLFTASVIEAMARRRNSQYEIEVLYEYLRSAGDVLDNDYMRNLPRKPAPPLH
jgi:hypothetical protein